MLSSISSAIKFNVEIVYFRGQFRASSILYQSRFVWKYFCQCLLIFKLYKLWSLNIAAHWWSLIKFNICFLYRELSLLIVWAHNSNDCKHRVPNREPTLLLLFQVSPNITYLSTVLTDFFAARSHQLLFLLKSSLELVRSIWLYHSIWQNIQ